MLPCHALVLGLVLLVQHVSIAIAVPMAWAKGSICPDHQESNSSAEYLHSCCFVDS